MTFTSSETLSGSTTAGDKINDKIQIWNNGNWRSIVNFIGLPLYPRMHVSPDGRIFMSGPLAKRGACWGGAYEALNQLEGVQFVRPIVNTEDSTDYVYLDQDGIPDLEQWPRQFASSANESYQFRGVEVTLTGTIERQGASCPPGK